MLGNNNMAFLHGVSPMSRPEPPQPPCNHTYLFSVCVTGVKKRDRNVHNLLAIEIVKTNTMRSPLGGAYDGQQQQLQPRELLSNVNPGVSLRPTLSCGPASASSSED
jgi:hypothetical protein